jgi:hypothetical protein
MLPKKGRKSRDAARVSTAIIGAALATPVVAFAQSTYIGASGGNWSVPGNWNPSGVPGIPMGQMWYCPQVILSRLMLLRPPTGSWLMSLNLRLVTLLS